ncbi:MAG: efflux RND transporter periplasmic adaptor subunit [Flavobacteriales bacterium]
MKKARTPLIIIFIIGALVFIKIKFLSNDNVPKGMPPSAKGKPSLVSGYIVKNEDIDNKIFITGTILSNEEVVLMPEMAGKVTSISFKEGSIVNKGQLLVKINDADLQAQLKKAKLQEKLITEKEERQKKLFDINGISKEEYDATQTLLSSYKADIEVLEAQIAKTEIRAPFTGTIGIKKISEGSYVTPNTAIAVIQQTNPLKIDFSIPEKYAALISNNDVLEFSTEGSDNTYKANVSAIEPKVDIATRTIQMRALTDNHSGKIFPGSFARIQLSLGHSEKGILIPTEALIPVLKGQKVFVSRKGIAEEVMVTTGVRTSTKIQILQGLQEGDTLIISGIMQMKKGNPLKFISVK